MKKIISAILAIMILTLSVFAFASCGKKDKMTIGIIQFGSHESLNNCYKGIMEALAEKGYTEENCVFEYVNSNFDPAVSQSQARKMVNEKVDVIVAIATPSAVAAATAADGEIPVVYCAVTDNSVMANYENTTGTSDIPNFEKQLEVITSVMGKSNIKIGVMYSVEESSSPVQVASLKEAAKAYAGMEIIDTSVADITTIDAKTNELLDRGVDCLVNLLDNTIVGKLQTNILPITDEKNIPVFGSEIEQVKVGCAASASIDYVKDVGRMTGDIVASILGGKSASNIPAATITNPTNYYNSKVLEKLGLKVPTTVAMEDVAN